MKSITLPTNPPVDVKLWEKSKRYYWRYDYEGCPKNGPFKSQQQAITDARTFSAQLWHPTERKLPPDEQVQLAQQLIDLDLDDYLTQYQQFCDYCIAEGMCYDVEVGDS